LHTSSMSTSSRICRFFSKLLRLRRIGGQAPRGFTLIELLVVSLIVILITGTILFRQQGFNSSTLLRSLAYSVALSVRQAQVYGVSVRESGVNTSAFGQGYGVVFSTTGCGLQGSSRYQLFADLDGNGVFAGHGTTEALPCYTVGNGRGTDYKVWNFCAHAINGSDTCMLPSPPTAVTALNIYFRRPNPDACFAINGGATCAAGAVPVYDYAYIELRAQGSADYRIVKVSSTGQIAVCKVNVPAASC